MAKATPAVTIVAGEEESVGFQKRVTIIVSHFLRRRHHRRHHLRHAAEHHRSSRLTDTENLGYAVRQSVPKEFQTSTVLALHKRICYNDFNIAVIIMHGTSSMVNSRKMR